MNKKSQFYLIAAMIIIFVLIGFVVVRNYASVSSDGSKIYDLGKEFEIETGKVYDYGIYNEKDSNALNNLIEDWAGKYYNYSKSKEVEDWIFIYGKNNGMTALTFSTVTSGSVSIIGSSQFSVPIQITERGVIENITPNDEGTISVKFKDTDYSFKLEEGQNFFFVIKSGEYVAGDYEK